LPWNGNCASAKPDGEYPGKELDRLSCIHCHLLQECSESTGSG
jgi:hypothetical protein